MQIKSKTEEAKTTIVFTESHIHEISDDSKTVLLSITLCMVGSNQGSDARSLDELLPWNKPFTYDWFLLFDGDNKLNIESIERRSPDPKNKNSDANILSEFYKQQAKQLLGLSDESKVSEEDGAIAIDANENPIIKPLHQLQQRWAFEHSPLNSYLNMTCHFEVKIKSDTSKPPETIRVVPELGEIQNKIGDWFYFSRTVDKEIQKINVFAGETSFVNPDSGTLKVTQEVYGSLKKTLETLSAPDPTPKPLVGIDLGFLDSIIPLFDIPYLVNRFFETFRGIPSEGKLVTPNTRLNSFEILLQNSVADQLWLTSGASYWGEGYAVKTAPNFAAYSSWAKNEFARFLLPPESDSNNAFATTKAYLDGLIAGFSSNVFLSSHVLSLYQQLWKGEFDEKSLSRDLSSGMHLLRQKRHAISVINLQEIANTDINFFFDCIFTFWKGYVNHQVRGTDSKNATEPNWANFGPLNKPKYDISENDDEMKFLDRFLDYGKKQIETLKERFNSRESVCEPTKTPLPIVLKVTSEAGKNEFLSSKEDGSCRVAFFIKDKAEKNPTYTWRSCNWVLPSLPNREKPDSGNFEDSVLVPVNLPEVNEVQTSRVYLSNEKSSLVANTEISYQTVETHSFRVTEGKDLLKRDNPYDPDAPPDVQVNWIELGEVISLTVEKELLVKCSTSVFFDDPVQISVGGKCDSKKEGKYWHIRLNPSKDNKVSFKISSEALGDESDISENAFEILLASELISIVKLDYARFPTIDLRPVDSRSDESHQLPYFVYGRSYDVCVCRIPRSGFLPKFLRINPLDCVTPIKNLSIVEEDFPISGSFTYHRDVFVHPFRLKHASNDRKKEKANNLLKPFESMPDVFPVTLDLIGKSSEEKDSRDSNRMLFILLPNQNGEINIDRPVAPFWDWFAWNFRTDTKQLNEFETALKEEMENREQFNSSRQDLPDCCVTKCRIKIEKIFSLKATQWETRVFDIDIDKNQFKDGKSISLYFNWVSIDSKMNCQLAINGSTRTIDLGSESSYCFTLTSLVPEESFNRFSVKLQGTSISKDENGDAEFASDRFFIELALERPDLDQKLEADLYEALKLNSMGGIIEARLDSNKEELLRIGRVELSQQIWYWDGRNFDQKSSPLPSYSGTTANKWDGIGFGNRFDHDCRTRSSRIIAGIEDQLIYTEDRSKVLRGDVMRFALRGYDRYLGLRPKSSFIDASKNGDRWKRLYVSTKFTEKLPPPSIRFVNQLAYSLSDSESQSASVAVVFNDRWLAAAGVAEKLETRIVRAKVMVNGKEKEFYNAGVDPTLSATKTLPNETGKISDISESALKIRGPFAFTFDKVARTPELVRTAFVLELNCGVVEHLISKSQTKLEDVKSLAYAGVDSQSVTIASFLCQVQFRRVVRESGTDSSPLDSDWCDPVWVEFTPNASANTLVPVSGTICKHNPTLTFGLKFNEEFETRHERWLILLKQQRDIRGELVNVFDKVLVPIIATSERESDGLRTTVTYDEKELQEGDYIASILLVRKRNAANSSVSSKTEESVSLGPASVFQRMFGELGSTLGDPLTIREDPEVARPLLGPSFPLKIGSTAKRD